MREGGYLEQYAEPAVLFTTPASEFVADFIGAEHSLRKLSVGHIDSGALIAWPTVDADQRLTDCALAFDPAEADWLVVLDGPTVVGWLARADAAGPGVARDRALAASSVDIGALLAVVFAAMLSANGPGVTVTEAGRYLGVLTADGVVASTRG
jgi:osmoprotectant transport system ATP-binding protein